MATATRLRVKSLAIPSLARTSKRKWLAYIRHRAQVLNTNIGCWEFHSQHAYATGHLNTVDYDGRLEAGSADDQDLLPAGQRSSGSCRRDAHPGGDDPGHDDRRYDLPCGAPAGDQPAGHNPAGDNDPWRLSRCAEGVCATEHDCADRELQRDRPKLLPEAHCSVLGRRPAGHIHARSNRTRLRHDQQRRVPTEPIRPTICAPRRNAGFGLLAQLANRWATDLPRHHMLNPRAVRHYPVLARCVRAGGLEWAIAFVAKRKPASSVSGEQSDRQPSGGASRPTGPQLAASTDADSARTRGRVASVEMPARGWIEETRGPTKGVLLTVITSLGAVSDWTRQTSSPLTGCTSRFSSSGLSVSEVVGTPHLACRQRLMRGTLESC